MRKIVPKPLMTLRDSFVILRDGKFIANHNLYSEDGTLLSPSGYPIPKYTQAYMSSIGDELFLSSPGAYFASPGFCADDGATAECSKNASFGGTSFQTRIYFTEVQSSFALFGVDCRLPGVTRYTRGAYAGRDIARHPSAYMDVTSDALPIVLETDSVHVAGTTLSAGSPTGGPGLFGARLLAETDTKALSLNAYINTTINTNNGNIIKLSPTSKNFDYRYTSPVSVPYGKISVHVNREKRLALLLEAQGASTEYGTAGFTVTCAAYTWTDSDMVLSAKATPLFTGDRYRDASYTVLNSQVVAGFKVVPHTRAVKVEAEQTTLYVPNILGDTQPGSNNIVRNAELHRVVYDDATAALTKNVVTFYEEDTGLPSTFNEEMMPVPPGNWSSLVIGSYAIVHHDYAFLHEVEGSTYVVMLRMGTGSTRRTTNPIVTNTVQYVVRLDPTDPAKAYLVSREVLPGFFGIPQEVMYSYAGNTDHTRLYAMCENSVYILRFDSVLLKYVRMDTEIAVNAQSMLVRDNEDLWLIDVQNKLYSMRVQDSDIVRVQWGDAVTTNFIEAPYDAELKVSAVNHLGSRAARSVELFLEGNAVFKGNGRNKITLTTSGLDDVTVLVTIKGHGQIYVTPLSVV